MLSTLHSLADTITTGKVTTLQKTLIAALVCIAGLSGYILSSRIQDNSSAGNTIEAHQILPPNVEALLGKSRPDFTLPDLQNKSRNVSEWDGKALLINFWATWCAPCRKEIPAFLKARQRYHSQGFEIIGIALDLPDMVSEFASEIGIDYPLLYGQQNATEIAQQYGNILGTLPYSIFIDSNGKIQHIHNSGEISEDQLNAIIPTLLTSQTP